MRRPPRSESVAKALRRKAQLQRWGRQAPKGTQPFTAATMTHATVGQQPGHASSPSSRRHDSIAQSSRHCAAEPLGSSSSAAVAPSSSAGQTLQAAYAHRHTAQPSTLQRRLTGLLRHSTSKSEAAETFFLVAHSDQEPLTPATFSHFTSTLLKHNVAAQMGRAAYEAALADAVGVGGESRFNHVEPEEAQAFTLYQARRLERYAVRGTHFNEQLGLTLEGADNGVVALTEYQLRKHAARALPVSCDVLEELLHLDVSWSTALQLYDYARQLGKVDPPAGMTVRVMGLMTGYRTNGLGSRPWAEALRLYESLLQSGYEVPLEAHAVALDAIWRCGETFVKPHQTSSAIEQAAMWAALVRIREYVPDAQMRGEEGCRFTEALVKAAAASGHWVAAVQTLRSMDLTTGETSHRLLVPTAETFLFAMAACNVAQNAAHATALHQAFRGLYTLRSAHPEALAAYLHSLRHVEHLSKDIGTQVETLVLDGKGLDRPCCVACLQLLASQRVHTKIEKQHVAQQALKYYDANPWPQQPQARQKELQTVFRCCHLIAAATASATAPAASCSAAELSPLLTGLKARVVEVFGAASPEYRWLEDTEVYGLLTTPSWTQALTVFQRQVRQRPPTRMADLPIPLRQIRFMFAQALLRHARTASISEDRFLLEEEGQEVDKASAYDFVAFATATVRETYAATAATVPHAVLGELMLLQALHAPLPADRQRLGLKALRELSHAEAAAITPRLLGLISQALSLTEEHVQGVLVEGSAQLRGKVLQSEEKRKIRAPSPLEKVFL